MPALEPLHTFAPDQELDTTRLTWASDAAGLTFWGTLVHRGQEVAMRRVTWTWPKPADAERWYWMVVFRGPDHTVAFVRDIDREAPDYRYPWYEEIALAHGWLYGPDYSEPWERMVFYVVCHAGASWAHPLVGQHATAPTGSHHRYPRGQAVIVERPGMPEQGGGNWPTRPMRSPPAP